MTRETKIGLLVGLGFIVVFAVLLSNNSSAPPQKQRRMILADKQEEPAIPLGRESKDVEQAFEEFKPANESQPAGRQRFEVVSNENEQEDAEQVELPAVDWGEEQEEVAAAETEKSVPVFETVSTELADSATQPATEMVEVNQRTAPPVPEPIEIPELNQEEPAPAEQPQPEPKEKRSKPRQVELEEYVVQKGDTLWKIAKKHYGTAQMQAVEFLARANKKTIKSKDFVVQGQKLVIPELPRDMFEPVVNFDASKQDKLSERAREIIQLVNNSTDESGRRAPADFNKTQPQKQNTIVRAAGNDYRVYEIKPKDTFSSIAEKELGSTKYWKQIQKLNPRLEPTKLKPGVKIKLPEKDTLSEANGLLRASV